MIMSKQTNLDIRGKAFDATLEAWESNQISDIDFQELCSLMLKMEDVETLTTQDLNHYLNELDKLKVAHDS